MAISAVRQNYYQDNVAAGKSGNDTEKSALEKTGNTKGLSEAEEMELFKKEFYAELERIPKNSTIVNLAINISEEAFENMKADPEYRAKIMSALRRDVTSSFAPLKASLLLTVGATEEDYRGDSWCGPNNDSEFFARSQGSFYKKTGVQKDRRKELLEEYLEKRAQAKKQMWELLDEKVAKSELERSRLAKMRAGNHSGYAAGYTGTAERADGRAAAEVKTNASTDSRDKVQAYYEQLCRKFPQIDFNINGGVLPGNSSKVTVNLSYDCLKKMAGDPEFAKEIEWNLSGEAAANSMVYGWAQRDGVVLGGRTVTYDANGNRQSSCGGMRTANAGNGNDNTNKTRKKYKEEEERWLKARKRREEKEKLAEKTTERRAERKAQMEEETREHTEKSAIRREQMAEENAVQIPAGFMAGMDISTSISTSTGFDIKA